MYHTLHLFHKFHYQCFGGFYILIYTKLEEREHKRNKETLLFGKHLHGRQITLRLKGRFVRSMSREVTLRKILCDLNSRTLTTYK